MENKALIAMSGGVDSSVAAALMLEKGYDCIGVTMKLFQNEDVYVSKEHSCCSLDDVEDARSVAYSLHMRHYVFNFSDDFAAQVIDRFVRAYEKGLTPNPCIDCNRYMKFDLLYRRARELDCNYVVTGHYARTAYDASTGRHLLLKGKNKEKDQSYVLCFMTQEQIAHTIFPLGEYDGKEQVRELAQKYGFVNAAKHDSQDICFVQDGDYGSFIEKRTGKTYPSGDFTDLEGNVLGTHKGMIRYTIGQRKGLGLSLKKPMYVFRKDMENNRVILADNSDLFSQVLTAGDFNWISVGQPQCGEELEVTAKTRYRSKEGKARATLLPDGKVRVVFDEPQRAITAGQAVVLYDGDIVVGGGTILGEV